MPDDSFLLGHFTWNSVGSPSRLNFFAAGELPADAQIIVFYLEAANEPRIGTD